MVLAHPNANQLNTIVEIASWRLALAQAASRLLMPPYSARRLRAVILRLGGARIHLGAEVCGGVVLTGANLYVGRGAFIGPSCMLEVNIRADIRIGDNVAIGPRTTILTSSHDIGPSGKRAGRPLAKSVNIGPGAWIGAGCTVLPGVSIGAGAIVGAGSLVNRDVEPNVLVAGVPARMIRAIDTREAS